MQPTIRSSYFIGVINTNGETNISVTEVPIKALAPAFFSAASSQSAAAAEEGKEL
ncbi:hypothetical protein [Archangium lansingense]|uniref:Uncharacterized protein n=1 Tax=Archangium lansingense TaxID=2995310 RepID=A0ABT4AD05_9BACT|nr:hypothetical protein [Archangium lansinium]MCY1079099.1 hypothetical protein [Archangium lansinium]